MSKHAVPGSVEPVATDDLIGLLYDAAADPDLWETFLRALARHFRSSRGEYNHYDMRDERFSVLVHYGLEDLSPAIIQRYGELTGEDPRYLALKRRFGDRTGAFAIHCRSLVTDAELHASRFYQEVLQPGQVEYVLSAHIRSGDSLTSIGIMRSPAEASFSDRECTELELLLPHLQRAMRIQKHLAQLDFSARSSLDTLDRLPTAVVIVDREMTAQIANQAARDLLALGDGIALVGRAVAIDSPAQRDAVGAAVRDAIDHARADRILPGRSFALPRREGRPLALHLSTLWGNRLRMGLKPLAEPLAVLFLSDPGQPPVPSAAALSQFFGLTEAEARLTALLASGRSLSASAKELGRSVETCRTHLKAAFGKTGVARQSDLVRLVLSTPAWIDPA